MRAMGGENGGEEGCVGGRGGNLNRLYSHTLTQMYYSLFGGNSALILLTLTEEFHSPSPTVFLTSSSPYCFQLSHTHTRVPTCTRRHTLCAAQSCTCSSISPHFWASQPSLLYFFSHVLILSLSPLSCFHPCHL